MMTRHEHIEWCKERALKYLDSGEISDAIASMSSDMGKHPECAINPSLIMLAMMAVTNHDIEGARRFIVGFN